MVEDQHPVHRLGHLGQEVAGHQHGAAPRGQAAQQVTQPADPLRVQAVGRLVQDQQLRIGEQGGGQAETLAHAEREPADPAVGHAAQLDQPEDVVDPREVRLTRHGLDPQVVTGRPARMKARRLQHRAHLMQRLLQIPVGPPADGGRARVRPHQAEQHP